MEQQQQIALDGFAGVPGIGRVDPRGSFDDYGAPSPGKVSSTGPAATTR